MGRAIPGTSLDVADPTVTVASVVALVVVVVGLMVVAGLVARRADRKRGA